MDLSKLDVKNQIEYFKALHEETDPKKKKEIVEALFLINRPLVRYVSNRIWITKEMKLMDREELESIGISGLVSAIENFDYRKGFEFSTFARQVIKSKILSEMRRYKKLGRGEKSLEENIYAQEKSSVPLKIKDSLVDNKHYFEDLVDKSFKESIMEDVKDYLSTAKFTDNERRILNLSLKDMNDVEIGKELGVTRSAVGFARNRALYKLREHFQPKADQDYLF